MAFAAQAIAGFDVPLHDRISIGGRYGFTYVGATEFEAGNCDAIWPDASTSHGLEAVLKIGLY